MDDATIRVSAELHRRLKAAAAMEGKTLSELCEGVLADWFKRQFSNVSWPTPEGEQDEQ